MLREGEKERLRGREWCPSERGREGEGGERALTEQKEAASFDFEIFATEPCVRADRAVCAVEVKSQKKKKRHGILPPCFFHK